MEPYIQTRNTRRDDIGNYQDAQISHVGWNPGRYMLLTYSVRELLPVNAARNPATKSLLGTASSQLFPKRITHLKSSVHRIIWEQTW